MGPSSHGAPAPLGIGWAGWTHDRRFGEAARMAPAGSSVDADEEPLAMTWSIGRISAVVAGLAIVVFWAWVFSGAPKKDNPDLLSDRTYAAQLEDRCQQLRDELDDLPSAIDLDDVGQRVAVLDDANLVVGRFIDDVAATPPSDEADANAIEGWLGDWRTYLANREDYAERLLDDESARLLLDESPLGDPVDKTIEVFADVNAIPACATPGDVG
jgi:hypothetical protein